MASFYEDHPWFTYLLTGALILAAGEIGHRIGVWWRRKHPMNSSLYSLSTLEGAALGLLALIIAFTFSMTINRFDARLNSLAKEASAIGTAWLRAGMLAEPRAGEVRQMLRDYVQLRIDLSHSRATPAAFERAIQDSYRLQAAMWERATTAVTANPRAVPEGLFVQSLNDVFDLQEARIAAARNQVPPPVFVLLYVVAAVAIGLSGYVAGSESLGGRIPIAIMAVLVSCVTTMIADFDKSRTGFITVNQQVMEDLRSSMD